MENKQIYKREFYFYDICDGDGGDQRRFLIFFLILLTYFHGWSLDFYDVFLFASFFFYFSSNICFFPRIPGNSNITNISFSIHDFIDYQFQRKIKIS